MNFRIPSLAFSAKLLAAGGCTLAALMLGQPAPKHAAAATAATPTRSATPAAAAAISSATTPTPIPAAQARAEDATPPAAPPAPTPPTPVEVLQPKDPSIIAGIREALAKDGETKVDMQIFIAQANEKLQKLRHQDQEESGVVDQLISQARHDNSWGDDVIFDPGSNQFVRMSKPINHQGKAAVQKGK